MTLQGGTLHRNNDLKKKNEAPASSQPSREEWGFNIAASLSLCLEADASHWLNPTRSQRGRKALVIPQQVSLLGHRTVEERIEKGGQHCPDTQ